MFNCSLLAPYESVVSNQGARQLRLIAGGLLGGMGDNKKGMRDATVAAMQVCCPHVSGPNQLVCILPTVPSAVFLYAAEVYMSRDR